MVAAEAVALRAGPQVRDPHGGVSAGRQQPFPIRMEPGYRHMQPVTHEARDAPVGGHLDHVALEDELRRARER